MSYSHVFASSMPSLFYYQLHTSRMFLEQEMHQRDGDGYMSTPPWHSAAGTPSPAAWHHGRIMMQHSGKREGLFLRMCIWETEMGPRLSLPMLFFVKAPFKAYLRKCAHQTRLLWLCVLLFPTVHTMMNLCVCIGSIVTTGLRPPQFESIFGKWPNKQKPRLICNLVPFYLLLL